MAKPKPEPEKPQQIVIGPQPGGQYKFLELSWVDIVFYGGSAGSGKTFALLLEALRHVHNPRYTATIFRRTNPQILQPEGLWDTSEKIYPYANARPLKGKTEWHFPSGARIEFRHMENEADRFAWLGAGIPLICFDEIVTFEEVMFWFMVSRNRSTCGVRPYIRAGTNPLADSWVAKLIQWWWDPETGYAIPERGGVVKYLLRVNDQLEWGDSAEELKKKYPTLEPKSFTFIPSTIHENKILLKADPGALTNLELMPRVEREMYLKGNWKIKPGARNILRREWFKIAAMPPAGLTRFCRYWDLAATEPKEGTDPDWTCGCLIGMKEGIFYILDMRRLQGTPKTVEDTIKQCAQLDPPGTRIRMEEEGGASGVNNTDHYARDVLPGFDFKGVKALKNKVLRAGAFATAAEHGYVVLVKGNWDIEAFLAEADNFAGEDEKNDQIDAATGGQADFRDTGGALTGAVPAAVGRYDPVSGTPAVAMKGTYTPIGF